MTARGNPYRVPQLGSSGLLNGVPIYVGRVSLSEK